MSMIEQKQKEFDNRKQDHGDAAQRQGRFTKPDWAVSYERRVDGKRDQENIKTALTDELFDDLEPTATELQTDEDAMSGMTEVLMSDLFQESDEAHEADEEANYDDESTTYLEDAFNELSDLRAELVRDYSKASGPEAQAIIAKILELDQQIESIAGEVPEEVEEDQPYFTEADFGVKSRHEINHKLAKQATLDPEFSDDDDGDSDFNSHIRIKNRL